MMTALRALLCLLWIGGQAFAQGPMFPGPGAAPPPVISAAVGIGTNISNSASSLAITTSGSAPSGAYVIVATASNAAGSSTVSTVAEGANSFTNITAQNPAASSGGEQWGRYYPSGLGSGATITVTWAASQGFGATIASFYVTGLLSSPVDKVAGNNGGSSASDTATTAVLSQANEIAIGSDSRSNHTVTDNFTNIYNIVNGNGNARLIVSYSIRTTTAAVTYTVTPSPANGQYAIMVSTLKGY